MQILKILAIENRVKAASLVSSVCSQVALYPMDSIKTRMQVSQFRSVWDCLNHMRHTEGLRMGLYRGIFGPTVSYTFVRMLTFDWYAKMKYNIDDYVETLTGKSILVQVNTLGSTPTLLSTACFTTAGAVTGFTVSFLACPFELLKVGRQMSGMLSVTGEQQAAAVAKGSGGNMVAGAMTTMGANGGKGAAIDKGLSRVYRDKGTFSAGLDLYRRIGIRGLYSGIHLHASEYLDEESCEMC
jgi:solute carrier family 25 carnitine/acylcarnitine transporter 20/29